MRIFVAQEIGYGVSRRIADPHAMAATSLSYRFERDSCRANPECENSSVIVHGLFLQVISGIYDHFSDIFL